MQLSHSFKFFSIAKKSFLLFLILSIVGINTLTALAEDPPPAEIPEVLNGATYNYTLLKEQFNEDNCNKTFNEFPYLYQYEEKDKKFIPKLDESKQKITTNTLKETLTSEAVNGKQSSIFLACQCLSLRYKFPKPTITSKPTAEDKEKFLQLLGRQDWIRTNIINNKDTCSHFQTKSDTRKQRTSDAKLCTPDTEKKEDKNVTCTTYCTINPKDLEQKVGSTKHTLTIGQFRTIDINSNCKIDTSSSGSQRENEQCKVQREIALQECKVANSTDSILTGELPADNMGPPSPGFIPCNRLGYYYCDASGNFQYLNFDGDLTAGGIDSAKTLLNKDQEGFVGFFRQDINNQGAGTNNPAINLILYVINLLAGLSFLIAVAMLILGGFYLVMASGNSEMTDKGKNAIKNFIFAITFTLLSYAIVTFIQILLYS